MFKSNDPFFSNTKLTFPKLIYKYLFKQTFLCSNNKKQKFEIYICCIGKRYYLLYFITS